MNRTSGTLLLLATLAGFWLVYPGSDDDGAGNRVLRHSDVETSRFDKFHLAGLEHTLFEDGRKLYTLRCRTITHRKKKLGPFTLNPVKEIKMSGVEIEVFPEDMLNHEPATQDQGPASQNQGRASEGTEDPVPIISQPLSQAVTKMLGHHDLGFVSRIVMSDVTLLISDSLRTQITIRADTATLGAKDPDARFDNGFSMVARNNRKLTANKAVWDHKMKAFHIPGTYVISGDQGPQRASNAFFGINGRGDIVQLR